MDIYERVYMEQLKDLIHSNFLIKFDGFNNGRNTWAIQCVTKLIGAPGGLQCVLSYFKELK